MSKTVAIISNDHAWTYNLRKEIISALIEQGHRVVIIVGYGKKVEELKKMGCEIIDIPVDRHGKNPFNDLKLFFKYKRALRMLKPDIVFTYTIKPNVYGGYACRLLGIPYVANITGLGTAVENKGIMQKITLMLMKIGLKKAKMVFFQNTDNMQFLVDKKVVNGRFSLLPGSGVNTSYFNPLEYPPSDTVEFVFISRIMREKGIDQYLDAAVKIKQKYPNTRFHICGFCEQSYENKIDELSRENIIVHHGMVDDVREVLKNVHCTIHPTYYPEGLSNVLLESCASARPIITTNRSGCREVVVDGVNGYVVNQKDSEDLVEKIEKFLSLSYDEKRAMGLAGRSKVEKEFDRNIVVDKYLSEL